MQKDWCANFITLIQSHTAISTTSTEVLIFWQPNLIDWYIILSWSVLCKDWIALVMVKVTVKVQNLNRSLSILDLCTIDIFAIKLLGMLVYYGKNHT